MVKSFESPLNGINLQCLPKDAPGMIETKRNESGFILETTGVLPELIDWLATKYNFTYTLLQDVVRHTDDTPSRRGLISYILSGEADMILAGNPVIASRMRIVDFSISWIDTPVGLLIPFPTEQSNYKAIVKPFEWKVWVLLLVSILTMIWTLYGLSRIVRMTTSTQTKSSSSKNTKEFGTWEQAIDYVEKVLFSQSSYCLSGKFVIRIAAGTWCLACFVLVTAYSSVLISFVVAPNLKPIIDSVKDIPKVKGLAMVVEKGTTLEVQLMMVPDPTFKYLGNLLKSNPSLYCNASSECIDKVRKGNRVYAHFMSTLVEIMNEEHRIRNKCNTFMIAKQPFVNPRMCLILRKNSPYTQDINNGILQLQENGLLAHWEKKYYPQPDRCLGDIKKVSRTQRISLNNLSGAFLVLLVGYAIALFAFIIEKIINYHKKNFKI